MAIEEGSKRRDGWANGRSGLAIMDRHVERDAGKRCAEMMYPE